MLLFIWHKFIQPLIDRWNGKPKLEGVKANCVKESSHKDPLTNGEANSGMAPAKEGLLNGHVKSD